MRDRTARDPAAEQAFQAAYQAARAASAELVGPSLAQRLARLPPETRRRILGRFTTLERARLAYSWRLWARPKQIAPTRPHRIWAMMSGRGGGKSRAGAERIRERIYAGSRSGAIIGPTLREIARYMIGGHAGKRGGSGLLDVFPPHQRPVWNKQAGEIHFHTGAVYYVVSAEDGEYRGGNIDTAWCDEVCKWEPGRRQKLWDNMEFSLRSDCGLPVEIIVTTTPNPHPFIKQLVADPDCITYLGTSDENAENLERGYISRLERRFGQSRKGRQERGGEILGDIEGALFSQALIDMTRARPPKLRRIVISVDPAISRNRRSDRTGIVAVGVDGAPGAERVYPLEGRAGKWRPEEWASLALDLYEKWAAAAIVGERNRGGDLVKTTVMLVARERARLAQRSAPLIPFVETQASKSKESRAEDLSVLHEQGRLIFPPQALVELEDEITSWDPLAVSVSPNLLDALVWGAWELCGGFGDPVTPLDMQGIAEMNKRLRRPEAERNNRRDLW